jgi:hypothetical protein
MPLTLTPEFRAQMESRARQRLQPPPVGTRDRGEWDRTISGIPGDVLFTLENLRFLADQGNRVAAWLWEREVKRLGLWYDRKLF